MKLKYLGYGLLSGNILILLGFMGISVAAFRPGFLMLVLLLAIAAALFGLYGYTLIIREKSYFSPHDKWRAAIPAIGFFSVALSLLFIGVFIAFKP